jgi:hypothetical protein
MCCNGMQPGSMSGMQMPGTSAVITSSRCRISVHYSAGLLPARSFQSQRWHHGAAASLAPPKFDSRILSIASSDVPNVRSHGRPLSSTTITSYGLRAPPLS